MSCHPNRPYCPEETVVDPTQTVYRDVYHPQLVRVVHNIDIVTRHHCVPVRCDVYRYNCRDEHVGSANNEHHEHHENCGCNRSSISRAKKSSKHRSKKK
ncbi:MULTISPECIES: hypothetical protein [unclassified Paenibacillus]|uniref:hypothetical protein n=1 Tax=unclassified Paenibacillus TaxID=185978 RepID=UPI00095458E0|nr:MULTISPECIES: hypothetical protein [unclassified Paenibacillus]SIQ50326.1 hypothetical protein SAMN05880555_1933 [Paenibacillus sp. RU4X]SIQ72282.1 hypothetical protein SAMN05880570_1931 [Paenibacillus sp. RU4T]